MAIIINSRNIYDNKINNVNQNDIQKIEARTKIPSVLNKKNATVYELSSDLKSFGAYEDKEFQSLKTNIYNYSQSYAAFLAVGIKIEAKYAIFVIDIPKSNPNFIIDALYTPSENSISINTVSSYISGTCKAKMKTKIRQNMADYGFIENAFDDGTSILEITEDGTITKEYGNTIIPNSINYNNSVIKTYYGDATELSADAIINLPYFSKIEISDSDTYYNARFSVIRDLTVYKFDYFQDGELLTWRPATNESNSSSFDYEYIANGTFDKYVFKNVNIELKGDSISLSLENKTDSVYYENTSDDGKIFSLNTDNELMQSTNYFFGKEDTSLFKHLYLNTLNQYNDGKETAVLICEIGTYYNEDGSIAKSIKDSSIPMLFEKYDKVIPMVYDSSGNDRPLSYKNNMPKVFEIHGIDIYFDGAIWQKLYIQEI